MYMGLDTGKPVSQIYEEVSLKPDCSATETSKNIEILLVASLFMIFSNKGITKAWIRLPKSAGWSAHLLFENP